MHPSDRKTGTLKQKKCGFSSLSSLCSLFVTFRPFYQKNQLKAFCEKNKRKYKEILNMKKIYNFIPGELISNTVIASRIFELITSIDLDKWIEVDERVYLLEFFQQNEEFYIMYLDPEGIVEKLYNTCQKDIINFMRERISYEYGEGVDIAICTKQIDNAVICNHDGQIFILKL